MATHRASTEQVSAIASPALFPPDMISRQGRPLLAYPSFSHLQVQTDQLSPAFQRIRLHPRRIHIDPCIHIPPSMLPLLDEGETEDDRKNLCLRSRFSSVKAEIWLLGSPSAPKPRRTTIALASDYGSIHAQLVRPFLFLSRSPRRADRPARASTLLTVQPRFH